MYPRGSADMILQDTWGFAKVEALKLKLLLKQTD
jgi:hypothetical protein